MSAAGIRAWENHFDNFPPGDRFTQQLLATLILLFHGANKPEGARSIGMMDVAPWLLSKEQRDEIQQKREDAARAMRNSRLVEALHNKRKRQGKIDA